MTRFSIGTLRARNGKRNSKNTSAGGKGGPCTTLISPGHHSTHQRAHQSCCFLSKVATTITTSSCEPLFANNGRCRNSCSTQAIKQGPLKNVCRQPSQSRQNSSVSGMKQKK